MELRKESKKKKAKTEGEKTEVRKMWKGGSKTASKKENKIGK